jgi:hypothetical protein
MYGKIRKELIVGKKENLSPQVEIRGRLCTAKLRKQTLTLLLLKSQIAQTYINYIFIEEPNCAN